MWGERRGGGGGEVGREGGREGTWLKQNTSTTSVRKKLRYRITLQVATANKLGPWAASGYHFMCETEYVEEIVQVPRVEVQEKIVQRAVEQIVQVPKIEIVEEIVQVARVELQER